MVQTYIKKQINVIASAELEDRLVELATRHGSTGYTIVDARGGGGTGPQSGLLDVDSNIHFMMIISADKAEDVLADLGKMIKRGHHVTVYVNDVSVLRKEKFTAGNP